jgi:hypothetical protein
MRVIGRAGVARGKTVVRNPAYKFSTRTPGRRLALRNETQHLTSRNACAGFAAQPTELATS